MKKDTIFQDTREKAVMQWLCGMEVHDDLAVRDGVKATREYIEDLKNQIRILNEQGEIKNQYLRKLKEELKGK